MEITLDVRASEARAGSFAEILQRVFAPRKHGLPELFRRQVGAEEALEDVVDGGVGGAQHFLGGTEPNPAENGVDERQPRRTLELMIEGLDRELRAFGETLSHPLAGWSALAAAMWGWHLPAAFQLALRVEAWHAVEHASFLAAGLVF